MFALAKSSFEPLKDASLKILTFKTVFLIALASDKRRGRGGGGGGILGHFVPSDTNLTGRRSLFLLLPF